MEDIHVHQLKAHIDNHAQQLNGRMDTLFEMYADTAQAVANTNHIFGPDGEWKEMSAKVDKHEAVYQNGKRVGWLFGALTSLISWDAIKNHLHWGAK